MLNHKHRFHPAISLLIIMFISASVWGWQQSDYTMALSTSQSFVLPAPFAFGFGTAERDGSAVANIGFNWMMVYDQPSKRQPVNVLYRVPITKWSYDPDLYYSRWQFQETLYSLSGELGGWIEAYEIGNEPNLYVDGWEGPPDAESYVSILCEAYDIIKIMDPSATVVSAGLAPVGRVDGSWNEQNGHNYLVQDEREYLHEFFAAGGGDCADAFGYHPLGFSASFDAKPDVDGGTAETNCANGFCFRGVEKIRSIVEEYGYGHKPIWATEIGWISEPADSDCYDDYSWAGRQWQAVTPEKQAENIRGAFEYAHQEMPWLGAMFVFNLNFDQAPYYHNCEQMRHYSIQNTPTETALREMIDELFPYKQYFPFMPGG